MIVSARAVSAVVGEFDEICFMLSESALVIDALM